MAVAEEITSIKLQDMGYSFNAKLRNIFVDVNYQFQEGEIYWIRGALGMGKSSLLKLLVALVHPTAGDLLINGHGTRHMSFEEFLPYRLQIGYSFDFGGLVSNKTLFENLMLPLQYHEFMKDVEARAWVEELAQRFEITKELHSLPSTVSGGTRKATVVARSFVMKPKVLVLDEPTVGLVESRRSTVLKLIDEKKKSGEISLVVMATENVAFAKKVFTKILEIKDQKIVEIK